MYLIWIQDGLVVTTLRILCILMNDLDSILPYLLILHIAASLSDNMIILIVLNSLLLSRRQFLINVIVLVL